MNKYRNTPFRGYQSKREANIGIGLGALASRGIIQHLREQVRYVLLNTQEGKLRTERPVVYIADFVYEDKDGVHVVDAKGVKTRDYILKRKMMKHFHQIEIEEL